MAQTISLQDQYNQANSEETTGAFKDPKAAASSPSADQPATTENGSPTVVKPLPYGGRPIPKQTAAGALLTGGFNTHKVYIGNLPDSATLADLEDCFGQLGQCSCSIKRGFGFVDYVDPSSAAEAVAKYHEGHFLGAQIKVELSHARQSIPKAVNEDGKLARNPPGSDRPSDARKPMHINGPPGQEKRRNNSFRRDDYRNEPPPPRRDDRYGPGGRDMFPPPSYSRDAPPYDDRYRNDYRGPPPPAPYPDTSSSSRYAPDYDRYGPPPPRGGPPPPLNYGTSLPNRGDRPYDPFYESPLPGAPPRGGSGGVPAPEYPPYLNAPRPNSNGPPPPQNLNYGLPPLGSYGGGPGASSSSGLPPPHYPDHNNNRNGSGPSSLPPPANLGYGSGIALDPSRGGAYPYDQGPPGPGPDRYDPRNGGGDRYNPYARPSSPPRLDDRRGGDLGGYGGRSPRRGPPQGERRRSLSPPRRGQEYDYGGPSYGGGPPPRSGSPPRYNGGYSQQHQQQR